MRTFDFGRELLKIVALVTMTADHIGMILYPDLLFLHAVGRLAFPLFAYLITLGVESTKKPRTYLATLLTFAVVSQVPYFLAFRIQPFERLNILFPLFLSVLSLYFFNRGNMQVFVPVLSLSVLSSILFNMEGTFYVVLTVGAMKLLRSKPELGVIALLALNLVLLPDIQVLALLAVPLILLHVKNVLKMEIAISDDSRLYSLRKYSFYAYYPLHLALLYWISITFF
ncbi:MAG: conjugal transfer protein TraX [Candidatus Bathyarchaeota archaeon]|nr:conjugal transfer protein TraX [Candidatus Bathyarchaeota archaeon]